MSYKIAIPTYKRYNLKTVRVLETYNIKTECIYIFVANKTEKKKYILSLPLKYHSNIIIGKIGLKQQRNFISDYFDEGEFIIQMDDDINNILELIVPDEKNKSLNRLKNITNLDSFLIHTYSFMKKNNIFLFGIYPVDNPFFMNNKYTTELKFIVGPFFGIINRHLKSLRINIDEKEDVLRTLLYYNLDKKVLRFNYITINTNYYKEKGGLQAENKNRQEESKLSCEIIVKRFPHLCKIKKTLKKNGHTELILKEKII